MIARDRIIQLLFLLHFSIYAVSPVFTTISPDNIVDTVHASDAKPLISHSISPFFCELIHSCFSPEEVAADPDDVVRILVKKTRAIIPRHDKVKPKFIEDPAIAEQQRSFFIIQTLQRLSIVDIKSATGSSFALYSGLSPPSA